MGLRGALVLPVPALPLLGRCRPVLGLARSLRVSRSLVASFGLSWSLLVSLGLSRSLLASLGPSWDLSGSPLASRSVAVLLGLALSVPVPCFYGPSLIRGGLAFPVLFFLVM